ncbi:DUF2927 domain-containing protein [Wenxinia saemankumensis]|uniref:DUF2927 domain-containing protein n=1 Tax=Wenxinia saemankumensis TaxID=1447782 RepID=A0A1M6GWC6_9RHOB|nr:DUF2927 domain-containing protein [Wenxinia saemankumensis]SHJ14210.1 hypothetical protein SAMN05444417_2964 [Wenxinia saemankumensis]
MRAAALCLALAAGPVAAQEDYIATHGRLTDEEFYRLVACGAPPGGECDMPFVRWPREAARALPIALAPPPPGYSPALAADLEGALSRAIAEINSAGAAIRLVRAEAKGLPPAITVTPLNYGNGERIAGSGIPDLEGSTMGAAFVYIWWDGRHRITEGRILMADDLPQDEVYPVLLEELTQSLGFMIDIRNPAYERDSVFSEDSNSVTRLGAQDRAALRRHYPR